MVLSRCDRKDKEPVRTSGQGREGRETPREGGGIFTSPVAFTRKETLEDEPVVGFPECWDRETGRVIVEVVDLNGDIDNKRVSFTNGF